ncbi:hypothetical protein ACFX14_036214 [Malus domestica]
MCFFYRSPCEQKYTTGCMSICDNLDNAIDQLDTSSGVGCSQTKIPSGLKNQTLNLRTFNNHADVWDFNPCTYALLVQEANNESTFACKANTPAMIGLQVTHDGACQ